MSEKDRMYVPLGRGVGAVKRRPLHGASLAVMLVAAMLLLAACGGSSSSGTPSNVTFAVFNPFSGADAAFGPLGTAGCGAAVRLINEEGGILHKAKARCINVDTRGDPADAVVAANRTIAATNNLVGIIGPSSDEALATVPLFNRAQIPMFADTGQAQFDKSHYQYFWRLSQADDLQSTVMALWARQQGYRYGALVFGGDPGGQTIASAVTHTYSALGGKIVANVKLALDQPDYRSEISKLLATRPRPQVIFTETDPATSATFFSELKQLSGRIMPTICDETALLVPDHKALQEAIGNAAIAKSFQCVENYSSASTPAHVVFAKSVLHVPGLSSSALRADTTDPYVADVYDSVNIMALAMTEAKSTHPVKYNRYIPSVVNAGPGKQVVSSYAQGVAALKAGHKIRYIGTVGANTFNAYHDSAGPYEIAVYNTSGKVHPLHVVSSQQIARAPR